MFYKYTVIASLVLTALGPDQTFGLRQLGGDRGFERALGPPMRAERMQARGNGEGRWSGDQREVRAPLTATSQPNYQSS